MSAIGILGAGTWGTALARVLANNGHSVTVWSAHKEKAELLAKTRRHPKLPDVSIPAAISYTGDMGQACHGKDIVVFAVASIYIRATAALAAPYLLPSQLCLDVAKGIEANTLLPMSEVIRSELDSSYRNEAWIVTLSGPTHAEEVAVDLPTTAVSACANLDAAEIVQDLFVNTCMRVYTNTDIRGVELCGALKNIIALAVGISTGLGYGDNTKAALITRGLAEIERLGLRMGCAEQTFAGLAGMGDLIVTATSRHSRNHSAGLLIGQGYSPTEAVQRVGMVVEGIHAIPAAMQLAAQYGTEMPITAGTDAIINHGATPAEIVERLMARGKKGEFF